MYLPRNNGLRLMNIPESRYIREDKVSILHRPVLHNRCLFRLTDDGLFTIKVPASFMDRAINFFRVVFITSCHEGIRRS